MAYIKEVEFPEVIIGLPEIRRIQWEADFTDKKDDLFICALGFEERCIWIPRLIGEKTRYKSREAICFEYSTNLEDNEINRSELVSSLKKYSDIVTHMQCDTENFAHELRQMIQRSCQFEKCPRVTFDVSVCTSKLLLTVMKILLEFNVELRLLYSEARIYHPTKLEAEEDIRGSAERKRGLATGVSKVFASSEHPGHNMESLPEMTVVFAAFTPDRVQAVISNIDENLLNKLSDRVDWIVGEPHIKEDFWRIEYSKKVNEIPAESQIFVVSTFRYKDTVKTLNKIYIQNSLKYHINILPFGSKMQSVGIAFFDYVYPDATIWFAVPEKYEASNYSEGCKDTWIIDFGKLGEIKHKLDDVGTIKVMEKSQLINHNSAS